MKIKDMTISALYAVFITICSYISIPTPILPVTLQVFAIVFGSILFTKKQAFYGIICYLIVGLCGVPVFANGKAGLQVLTAPSVGFLLGFIPLSLLINHAYAKKTKWSLPLAFGLGSLLLYSIGIPILKFNLNHVYHISTSTPNLIYLYCLRFLPTDCFAYIMAHFVTKKLRNSAKFAIQA